MKAIRCVAGLLLGGIFLAAAAAKAVDPREFALGIASYHLVPSWAAVWIGAFLPGVEAALGAALLCGVFVRGAALAASLLAALFAAAVTWGENQGLDFACGCFGPLSLLTQAGWATILLDLVLLGLGVFLLGGAPGPSAQAE